MTDPSRNYASSASAPSLPSLHAAAIEFGGRNGCPPLLSSNNTGGGLHLTDIHFPQAISGVGAYSSGRLTIDGLWGQFLGIAIALDDSLDVARIRNVHTWPFVTSNFSAINDYARQYHSVVFAVRVDGLMADQIFSFNARAVFEVVGQCSRWQIGSVYADFTTYVLVDTYGGNQFGPNTFDFSSVVHSGESFTSRGDADVNACTFALYTGSGGAVVRASNVYSTYLGLGIVYSTQSGAFFYFGNVLAGSWNRSGAGPGFPLFELVAGTSPQNIYFGTPPIIIGPGGNAPHTLPGTGMTYQMPVMTTFV